MKNRITAVLAISACAGVHAEDFSPSNYLLGDWNGARRDLHEQGVDFNFTYTNEYAYAAHGGDNHSSAYADQILVDTQLNLEKLVGLKGASVRLSLNNRNGENLNAEAGLGTLLNEQEIYGYGSVTRIAQFYYQQSLLDDKLWFKIGRLPMSGEVFPFSCKFQNLTFCGTVPGYITPKWYTWPVSQWGGVVNAKVGDDAYVQAAVYQVNPSFTKNSQGMNFGSPHGTTGLLAVGEAGWSPSQLALPGTYRLGIWKNTGDFTDMYRDSTGQPIGLTAGEPGEEHSAHGYYLMAQQQVYKSSEVSGRGLTVFANFIQSDRDVSYVERVWQAGFFYSAPFASRPQDEIGFAAARLEVNDLSAKRIRQQNSLLPVGATGAPVPGEEYPLELYYDFAVTPAISLRPNIQYVHKPSGMDGASSVTVLGLKTSIAF